MEFAVQLAIRCACEGQCNRAVKHDDNKMMTHHCLNLSCNRVPLLLLLLLLLLPCEQHAELCMREHAELCMR